MKNLISENGKFPSHTIHQIESRLKSKWQSENIPHKQLEVVDRSLKSIIESEKLISLDADSPCMLDLHQKFLEKHIIDIENGFFQTSNSVQRQEDTQKQKEIQELYDKTSPIKGTQVEVYLHKTRELPSAALSSELRYLKPHTQFTYDGMSKKYKSGTLVTVGRNEKGEVRALQLTYLDGSGRRKCINGKKMIKPTFGFQSGSFVKIQEAPETNIVVIAEGLETGFSLKEAGVKATIVSAFGLGNVKNYKGSESTLILAADNDDHKPDSKTFLRILDYKKHYEEAGKQVFLIKPPTPGHDFNDMLIKEGAKNIQTLLQNLPVDLMKKTEKEFTPHDETQTPSEYQSSRPQPEHSQHGQKEQEAWTPEKSAAKTTQTPVEKPTFQPPAQKLPNPQKSEAPLDPSLKTTPEKPLDPKKDTSPNDSLSSTEQKAANRLEGLLQDIKTVTSDEEKTQLKSTLKEKLAVFVKNPQLIERIRPLNKDLASKIDTYVKGMKHLEKQSSKGYDLSL